MPDNYTEDHRVTFHYHTGVKWEYLLIALVTVAVAAFYGGRFSIPPSAEAIAHKQEMERLRSEQATAQAEAVTEMMIFQTAMVTESLEVMMEMEAETKTEEGDP